MRRKSPVRRKSPSRRRSKSPARARAGGLTLSRDLRFSDGTSLSWINPRS